METNRKRTTAKHRYRKEDSSVTKKQLGVIISVAALLILAVVVLLSGCSGCSTNPGGATPDTAPTLESTIDESTYTFSDGITIGTQSVGGKTYKEARELAQKEVDTLIKDFILTITVEDNKYEYKKDSFTYTNNIEALLVEAARYNDSLKDKTSDKEKVFKLEFSADETSVDNVIEAMAKENDKEPQDATIGDAKNNEVSFVKECTGAKLDRKDLKGKMLKELADLTAGKKDKITIKAKVDTIQPKLTYDDLDGKIELLSSFTTYSTNTEDGNHNMALALASCNGSVIAPGETWSFNACTGNSNLTSLGYRYATVIIGGELVPGVGGGLCQSSTTIYNAAIRTNMEIVERYCHYYQSTYASAGLDATIDYPYLDLKLKNPTDYPMYFQCYMSGRTLYCNIYGYQDPSFDEVEIDSEIYEANKKENYYKASATRTFLKDGKVVYTEQLPYSTYHYVAPNEETTESTAETEATKPIKPTKPSKPVETTVPEVVPTQPVIGPTEATTPVVDPTEPQLPEETQSPTDRVEY